MIVAYVKASKDRDGRRQRSFGQARPGACSSSSAVHITRLTNPHELCASVSWGSFFSPGREWIMRAVRNAGSAEPHRTATPLPPEGQGFSPDTRADAKCPPALPKAVAKSLTKRQSVFRDMQQNRQQDAGATPAKQVTIKTRCFHSQLTENTRPRHQKGVNFSRAAESAPQWISTRQLCRIETSASHSKLSSSIFLPVNALKLRSPHGSITRPQLTPISILAGSPKLLDNEKQVESDATY